MIPIAIYHCNIGIVSRGKGKSAVAAAAYRSGEKITNEWDGMTHDYTRKRGVVHTEILLPPHAPPSFSDRATLVECGKLLQRGGYKIKVLNTINFKKSMRYNPFAYIRSEKDILKLVNTIWPVGCQRHRCL